MPAAAAKKSPPSAKPCHNRILVPLCALFTIAVPMLILSAFVLPHSGSDANAATPATLSSSPAAAVTTPSLTSPTAPALTSPTAPTAPVSATTH